MGPILAWASVRECPLSPSRSGATFPAPRTAVRRARLGEARPDASAMPLGPGVDRSASRDGRQSGRRRRGRAGATRTATGACWMTPWKTRYSRGLQVSTDLRRFPSGSLWVSGPISRFVSPNDPTLKSQSGRAESVLTVFSDESRSPPAATTGRTPGHRTPRRRSRRVPRPGQRCATRRRSYRQPVDSQSWRQCWQWLRGGLRRQRAWSWSV